MNFDKPLVLPKDIAVILSSYSFGELLECQNLGGIPNTTYKVVTEHRVIAIRIYSHGQSSLDHIKLELEVLQHLADTNFTSPHLLVGTNGQILQQWNGYWVCASEYIPGMTADKLQLTPKLVGNVGRLVASFEKAMASFKIDSIPLPETFIEKGANVVSSLGTAVTKRGLQMDAGNVMTQWERASEAFIKYAADLNSNIVHADIWPPNVICQGEDVAGLVDFDDCCFGATIIDVALSLMEFSMFQDIVLDEDLAVPFLANYFRSGGTISPLEERLIVNAMEMACAMWFTYEVIEAPVFEEAEIYLHRLELLRDKGFRKKMCIDIERFIRIARGLT
jgi:homoserine kinase type II